MALPVDEFDKDARSLYLQMQLYLQSLLLGARSVWPPDAEVGVARALNDEPGALEVRAQVIEQGGGLRFVVSCRRCSVVDGHPAGIARKGRFCEHVFP